MELEKIKIEGFEINGINKKNYELDFTNNKIIITGNNGVGKSSLLNLIFGIIKSNSNLYTHVRYDKITFTFNDKNDKNDKTKFVLESNRQFKSINELDINEYSRNIDRIKGNFNLIRKWLHLFKNDVIKEKILSFIENDNNNLNNFILFMDNELNDSSNLFKEPYFKISELSHIINIDNAIPTQFFGRVLDNIKQQVNIINSTIMSKKSDETEKLYEISKILKNKIEYYSSFRNAKEFIENKETKNNINELNSILISFELDKIDIDKISEELTKKSQDILNNLKSSFFDTVANNKWNDKEIDIKKIELLSKDNEIEDLVIKNLFQNILNDPNYKKRIIGYIQPFITEFDKIKTFKERINNFLKNINDCFLSNKKIIYEENKFFIESKDSIKKPFTKEELSSGEKQMFLLLQSIFLSSKKIIIIDEPENSLSIRWQQILRNSFDMVLEKKFIIITHSPYMIKKNDIEMKRIRKME